MTDKTQPEALALADELRQLMSPDVIKLWAAEAAGMIRRQHTRIAELEAELEAVGAGGVQALSAAPAVSTIPLYELGVELRRELYCLGSPFIWALYRNGARIRTLDKFECDFVDSAMLAASPTPPAEQTAITPETGNSVSAQGAAITSESGAVYADLPELTSTEINDACWAFVEAMPHNLPGPIWNGLKPAVYAAICKFLQAAPKAAPGEPSNWPETCDGKEQEAWEAWASRNRYDMRQHPLHYLFLHSETDAARQGWKAGLQYAVDQMRKAAPQQEAQELVGGMGIPLSCGKPLCSPGEHHPLCHLASLPEPQPAPAPLSDDVVLDAARYRWLREPHLAVGQGSIEVTIDDRASGLFNRPIYGAALDAAIDTAIAAQGDTP